MNFFQGRSAGRVRQSVFFPEKTEKGRRGAKKKRQPPERGGEIVIQQASDDCQAVLLHCRCDANIHSSFSSPHCVILLLLVPLALFLPFLFLLLPCLVSQFIFLSLPPLSSSLSFFLPSSLSSHLSIPPPSSSFSFSQCSQRR